MALFRVYTSDDSFTDIPTDGVSEFQVALTFARDRDGEHSTNGKFIPSWDTTRVTPEVIKNFKKRIYPAKAKVLVSIGNDHGHFPFQINPDNVPAWITAATESLTDIIKEYNLDGLDVFYEDFAVSPDIFFLSVVEVITNLKNSKDITITIASISPNIYTWETYYRPLYQCLENSIDYVVFQCFTSAGEGAHNIGDHRALLEKFKNIPPEKAWLGYTGIREEWPSGKFPPPPLPPPPPPPPPPSPPPFFFIMLAEYVYHGSITGASIKVTRWSITYFPPKWVVDVLNWPCNPSLPPQSTN